MKNIPLFFLLYAVTWLNAQTPQAIGIQYEVQNLETLNSEFSDYSPVPYQKGVVFTSARSKGGLFSCSADFVRGNYADLYFAKTDAQGDFKNPDRLQGDLNGKYHDGVAAFDPTGMTMYFSRSNRKGTNKDGRIELKIYQASFNEDAWKEAKELPFNSADFSTCHPTLDANGTTMYFASNRPGGYGGMDIYKVEKQEETWGTPINLGEKINTKGNEIFPFIDGNEVLYFSSNGHTGLGGLDVFSTEKMTATWTKPKNLGTPLNSAKDDFGYTAKSDGYTGFFTSNRSGGLGSDDIYQWDKVGVEPMLSSVCVIDKSDDTRITDATLKAFTTDATSSVKAISSCGFEFPVTPNQYYTLTVEKEGYTPVTLRVTAEQLLESPEFLIPIQQIPQPHLLTGTVRNQKDNTPISVAMVKILDKCTGEKIETLTDHRGEFALEVDCNCEYEIVALKTDFEHDLKNISTLDLNCNETTHKTTLALMPKPEPDPAPEVVKETFTVGQVIRLDNVYYDYDKFFIRSDAAVELNKVVDLLRKYPSMEIELGSHTDSRGSDAYNQSLSQKRAEAAVKHIISKGIASRRITAKGYGETVLVNNCANGVKCSDEAHQENRRTEIKITRLDDPNVKVID